LIATSAPSRVQNSIFSALPTVHTTFALCATASWIAIVPIPDAPPCTSSHSRFERCAAMKTFDQTVAVVSGSAAALTRSTPSGTDRTWGAGTATFAAYPPPASRAHTWSPTDHVVTSEPTSETTPEHSMPRMPGAPGGGG
jgi:hypothetical protein